MDTSNATSSTPLSLGARYVEVLMKLSSFTSLDENKAMYPQLMPRNTGLHVHGAATNGATQVKLKRLRGKYQSELNLPPGTDWAEDTEDYKGALKELSKHFMQEYALLIENQVFKMKVVEKELQRVESGHNASSIKKRMQAMKTNIRELLSVYYTWKAYVTEQPRTNVTEERLREVYGRTFPWDSRAVSAGDANSGNGSASAQQHFAQRYHTAKNQLQRTEEEVEFLKNEVVRLFNWCEERKQLVSDRIQVFDSKIGRLETANETTAQERAVNGRELRILKGKRAVHKAEGLRLNGIHEEAVKRWA